MEVMLQPAASFQPLVETKLSMQEEQVGQHSPLLSDASDLIQIGEPQVRRISCGCNHSNPVVPV